MDAARIEALVSELYRLVAELEDAAPGRSFAPDCHLLGSIGEVLAAARYGVTLTTASTKGKDATTPDGREVEIKTSAGKVIALRGDPPCHLLLLLLGRTARPRPCSTALGGWCGNRQASQTTATASDRSAWPS